MSQPTGYALLHTPRLSRGTAFTQPEREAHGLEGLLPPRPITLEMQIARVYGELEHLATDLQKYQLLSDLQARNETLATGLIYPPQSDILKASLHAAARIAEYVFDHDLAGVPRPRDIASLIASRAYTPVYWS